MEDKYVFSLYIRVIKRRDVIRCILLLRLCLRNRSCPPVSTGLFCGFAQNFIFSLIFLSFPPFRHLIWQRLRLLPRPLEV